jgi:hypothetical protein
LAPRPSLGRFGPSSKGSHWLQNCIFISRLLTVVVLLPVFRGCLALLHLFSAAFNAALDCCDAGLLLQVGVEIGSPNFAPGTGGAAQPPDGVVCPDAAGPPTPARSRLLMKPTSHDTGITLAMDCSNMYFNTRQHYFCSAQDYAVADCRRWCAAAANNHDTCRLWRAVVFCLALPGPAKPGIGCLLMLPRLSKPRQP